MLGKRKSLLTILGGGTCQGQGHIGGGHHCILRNVHGPHQVVHVEERVQFSHFLWGDDLRRDPYNTATEHKGTMTCKGPLVEVTLVGSGQAIWPLTYFSLELTRFREISRSCVWARKTEPVLT